MLTARYTRAQREAVCAAYAWTGVTAKAVAELARRGELSHPSGICLGPFEIPESTVRSIARRARATEAAARASLRLADLEPRDATERMRVELAIVIEAEFDRIEIEQSEDRSISGETIRQLARAVREFSSIPGPRDPRPPKPGAKVNGFRDESETRGGLAGKIVSAARR